MAVVHVCSDRLDDQQRGELIFAGDLVIFSGVTGLGAFRDRVHQLVVAELGSDPETAQVTRSRQDYLDAVEAVRRRVRHDTTAADRLLRALTNTGLDAANTYWDWVHLRVLPHGREHAAVGTGWHRDTWASNLHAQTNWWTPIYPLTSGRTIAFQPQCWDQPVANTSRDWVPQRDGGPVLPESLEPPPGEELRVVVAPGDLLCFSGAQLHGTVLNETGRARFSVEVRTICGSDIASGRGARNLDGAAPITRYRWFRHVVDEAPLPEPD